MKRLICIAMCFLVIVLSSCVNVGKDDITGDVKNKTQSSVDDNQEQSEFPEKQDEKHETVTEITSVVVAEALIAKIGAFAWDGGENYENVRLFAEAVKNADTEKIAEYTMGKTEYYDFLKDVKISSYEIYPFEFSPEKNTELVGKEIYNVYNDKYFVEFNVSYSENEEFPTGNCVYYLERNNDEALGNVISYFMPAEYALELYSVYDSKNQINLFVEEMLSGYKTRLYEGKNYPDTFDFTTDVHLITHLMAKYGYFEPPYSLNEINDFIMKSFDSNKGIELVEQRDIDRWLFYDAQITDGPFEEQELFGCSYAHGGTYMVYTIDKKVKDGDLVEYYITAYADFAHFAPAMKMAFTFEEKEDRLPKLMLIDVIQNYGREIVGFSF